MKQTVTKRCQSPNLWPLAALLLAQPCYGTSGVALFVDSFVVIATDAKRVNKFGGKATSFSNQCKILTANDRVAVASGLTEEEGVHFDARKILSDAMEESQSLYEAADMAASEMQRDLPAALGDFRKNNPDEFQELLSGSLQILIAGISRQGEVEVARRSIPYNKSRPVQTENASASKDHIGIAAIGESSAIDKEVARLHNTDGWEGKGNPTDLEDIARRFIALEIVDKPRWVGPPVSIVVVDSDGIHWAESGACQQKPSAVLSGTGI